MPTHPEETTALRNAPANGIRLIALDMDGTILERGHVIQPALVEALKALAARGVRYITATGRPIEFQTQVLPENGLGPAAGTPRAIMADEREIFLLDGNGYAPHREWNDKIRARWESLHPKAMAWLRAAEVEGRSRGWECFQHEPEARMYERGLPTLAFRDSAHAGDVCEWLAAQLAKTGDALVVNRNNRLIQLHDATAGKGFVVMELARLWGLNPEQILAVGDSANDFSMLDGRHGFRSGCPANADEGVKEAVRNNGGHVAEARVGLGTLQVLAHFSLA